MEVNAEGNLRTTWSNSCTLHVWEQPQPTKKVAGSASQGGERLRPRQSSNLANRTLTIVLVLCRLRLRGLPGAGRLHPLAHCGFPRKVSIDRCPLIPQGPLRGPPFSHVAQSSALSVPTQASASLHPQLQNPGLSREEISTQEEETLASKRSVDANHTILGNRRHPGNH